MAGWQKFSIALNRLTSAWRQVVKRSLAHWRLLSSVLIGVLLASAIMSGTVLYFDALRQLALKHTLAKHTATELDILLRTERGPTTREEYAKTLDIITTEIDMRVAWMLRDRIRGGKTPTFFLATPGNEAQAGKDNARTYFAFLPGLDQHITLLEGRPASDRRLSSPDDPPELEAIVSLEAAELFDVGVDDRLVAVPTWDGAVPHVNVVISGVYRRNEPADEEFWYLEGSALRSATGAGFRTIPFVVPEKSFLDVLGPPLPKMESTYAWLLKTDVGRLNAWNAAAALANIELMNRSLASTLPTYGNTTSLDNALNEYDRRIFFSKLPMFVVLILIAVVMLYYVATLSSLVVENRRTEIATLRSRGASPGQILTVFLLEGATIAIIAILVAPLLAAVAISVLGFTPVFSDLTGGSRLAVSITSGAYALSTLGGILSFVALLIPAIQASRIEVILQRGHTARPSHVPVFQRYYVDVLLLLISIFLLRQLTEQGSVVATNQLGESTVNQLLLALPGLVLLASAMVLLRLFPLAMNLGSRLLSYRLPAGPVMSLWQMARDPTHYARLSLLLILTAGLGIFASSFEATLERSFEERVLHSTGSDIRVDRVQLQSKTRASPTPVPPQGPTQEAALVEAYERVPGVERVSPVVRSPGRDLTVSSGGSFEMLATDGERLSEVAWFRGDLSDRPMDQLLRSLKVTNLPQGMELPFDASAIGIRVKPDRLHPTVRLTARLRNAADQHFNYTLGTLKSTEWMVLETPLEIGGREQFLSSGPLSLVSLQLDETGLERRLLSGSILIDEISVTTAAGETRTVEGFDDASGWRVIRNAPDSFSDELRGAGEVFEGESGSVMFSWDAGSPLTPRGIFHGPDLSALPVLASRSFVKSTGHSMGEEFEVSVAGSRIPVTLVGIFDLFPTMPTLNKNLLVADLTSIDLYANLPATERELLPIELWISSGTEGAEREALLQALKSVNGYKSGAIRDRTKLLAVSKVDPLVEAGWSALLYIAFAAVLILSCIGFLIHAHVSFRNREFQFALLRTVGFSTKQLITMVWLEQALVIALGLALGTWMGGRLGAAIMPFLGHNDFGGEVIPPFAIEVNWGALLLTYAAMLLVFGVITFGMIWFIRRISLQRILRLGER